MDNDNNNNKIRERIDKLFNKFTDEYPMSYASEMLCCMFDDLNANNFIINLCLEIWKFTPSNILTYDEVLDACILAQLSYNIHLLFLNLPDMCDYPSEWMREFKLNQIQLGIIWLTSFVVQESTEMVSGWQNKDIDKTLLRELALYYRNKIINRHRMIYFDKLDDNIVKRRHNIANILHTLDNEFYGELLYFFNVLCVVKKIKIPSYQYEILEKIKMIPYYVRIHPNMLQEDIRKKKKKKNKNHQLNSNKIMTQQLMDKYKEVHTVYNNKRQIGIPFL